MSARVMPAGNLFNNLSNRMNELSRRSRLVQTFAPQTTNSSLKTTSVCRNLFGPIDHEENLKFVQNELHKIASSDSKRWNFDFINEKPMEGRFFWTKAVAGKVPRSYEIPSLTAQTLHTVSTASPTVITTSRNVKEIVSIENNHPVSFSSEYKTQNLSRPTPTAKTQQKITDFMKAGKRSYSELEAKRSSEEITSSKRQRTTASSS